MSWYERGTVRRHGKNHAAHAPCASTAAHQNLFIVSSLSEPGVDYLPNLILKGKFVRKRIVVLGLLAVLRLAWSIPANAQEGMTGAEYGRRTQIEAKKAAKEQRKAFKKAAKKQRKAMKKYLKVQRKAAKQANRRAG